MYQSLKAVLIVAAMMVCAAAAGADKDATEAFQALLDEHWAASKAEKIYFRNDPDAWRMDGRLSEHTPAARQRRQAFNEQMLNRLAGIDRLALDDRDRNSYDVFQYERQTESASYEFPLHYFPFTSLFGYHTYFMEAPANMSFLSEQDYEDYLVSLADFPRYNAEILSNLRQAVDAGYAHYCKSISGYESTVSIHLVEDVQQSKLFVPFANFPASMGEDRRIHYANSGSKLIKEKVLPALQALLTFFEGEYLPNCRSQAGISSVDGGNALYQFLINYFTTTDLSPRQIHELGLSEVARIRDEMQSVIRKTDFEGDMAEFLEYLRTEPKFYAKTESILLGQAALISKTAEGALPRFFSLLPRGTYKIAANPSRGTFYMPSSGDGTTSGTYFVGTEDLNSQPLYTLTALTLHEGVPGHHLQSALAMEIGLPAFRRTLYHSAYGEGWGLYSERLGKEMGFYEDPYSDFGRLTYEAWRACRLVVDTGMHAFGWSRDKAVAYMLANTALSELEINNEVNRYITWPAQALSYKIGELKIRELRAFAEAQLGEQFDLRAFHDKVIGSGSLPIAVLEQMIRDWVSAQLLSTR